MWAVFLLSATVFAIVVIFLLWIGNKVMNAIKKDNCKVEKELENKGEKGEI